MHHTQHFGLCLGRALELAQRAAAAAVAPNPQVGAVLVAGGRIIGEGWHARYGGPHAEVEAIRAAEAAGHGALLPEATLYVSLEPCCHTGKKTPPCTELILEKKIPRVVAGCADPNPAVAGRGLARLAAAGVATAWAQDAKPFQWLIRHFQINQLAQRPYVTLKWAETADGIMGLRSQRLMITGRAALEHTHALRAAHAAVLVGAGTAVADDPALTLRHAPGAAPRRLVLAPRGGLPPTLRLLTDGAAPTLVITENNTPLGAKPGDAPGLATTWRPPSLALPELLAALYAEQKIGSILVEGGAQTLAAFLAEGLWDEAHVLRSQAEAPLAMPESLVPAPAAPPPHWARWLGQDVLLVSFAPHLRALLA